VRGGNMSRRKRRLTRGEAKRQKMLFVFGMITIICILSVGYAAFQTTINLSVTGAIKVTPDECFTVSDNGDGTGAIIDYNVQCGTRVKIPEKINNLSIVSIADTNNTVKKSFNSKNIEVIILPDTLTYIGKYSFYSNKIKKLRIPDSVNTIGDEAFRGNNLSSNLNLGSGVKSIGHHAFTNTKLTSLVLPEGLKSLSNCAFDNNYLTSVTIPDSVTFMGGGVFSNNSFPEDNPIVYGKNSDGTVDYSTIDSYARREVTNYEIPNTIKTIANTAFGFKNVGVINIPSSVETIGGYSFSTAKLTSVTLNEGLKQIGDYAFSDNLFTEITIPSTVTSISSSAFAKNSNLQTINVRNSENAISGSPWGASNATVNWIGSN